MSPELALEREAHHAMKMQSQTGGQSVVSDRLYISLRSDYTTPRCAAGTATDGKKVQRYRLVRNHEVAEVTTAETTASTVQPHAFTRVRQKKKKKEKI